MKLREYFLCTKKTKITTSTFNNFNVITTFLYLESGSVAVYGGSKCPRIRVGYHSHSNRYGTCIGTGTQRYLFSVLYSLSNNKNIYFSEKISPKLSISTFWTIGPEKKFFQKFLCVDFFLIIKWRHETFIFNRIKMKPFNCFGKQTEVSCSN